MVYHMSGSGLKSATANHPTQVVVELTDSSNLPCSVQQKITAELELINASTPTSPAVHTEVVTTSPSRYEVLYTAISRGKHKLCVHLNDKEIEGSPFIITVYPDPTQLTFPERVVSNLTTPYSIGFNSNGEMIISEKLNHQVSVFNIEGQKIRIFGLRGVNPEQMMFPQGIAIDNMDNIYVTSTHKLQKFTAKGDLIKYVEENFNDPYGIALYGDEVYVSDCNMHRIQVFDTDLNFIKRIGIYGKEKNKFNTPYDVKIDTDGNIYVAEWGNERVQVLNSRGRFELMINISEQELGRPSGLHIIDKYVYVSDYSRGCILVYETTSGDFITSFGKWGLNKGEFMYPYCITSCSDGYIYVCDRENGRVQIF